MNKEDKEINYITNRITIQQTDRWPEIEEWNLFQREKKEIQDRYPNKPWITYTDGGRGAYSNLPEEGWWEDWQRYKKEVTDLMLAENGNFSKFLYKIRPERADVATRIWLRGKYNTDYYKHGKKK